MFALASSSNTQHKPGMLASVSMPVRKFQMNIKRNCPVVKRVMFPRHTNPAGNIFGGIILEHIDVAGAEAARRAFPHLRFATVCFKEVIFKKPVYVGDSLTCWAEVVSTGTTSVTTKILVEVERHGQFIPVTEGEVVYAAVNKNGDPVALTSDGETPARKPKRKSAGRKKSSQTGCPALRQVMFPNQTGAYGYIFGGTILQEIDIAGAVGARKVYPNRLVTVAFKEVVFKRPVHVGDLLTCWSKVTKIGRTSITTKVVVEVERKGKFIKVTEGEVIYVAVDKDERPTPIVPDRPTAKARSAKSKTGTRRKPAGCASDESTASGHAHDSHSGCRSCQRPVDGGSRNSGSAGDEDVFVGER